MEKYIICECPGDSINWAAIPMLQIDKYQFRPEMPVRAVGRLCWSASTLHVQLTGDEPAILARYKGDFDPVWRDSCLELFLCPMASDGRYFNFEFNPNGASCFGFGYGRDDRMRLHPTDVRALLNVRTFCENNVWGVCFDIPIDVIRLFMPEFEMKRGQRMRGNLYACGDDVVPQHELMWNLITNGNSDFHQSEFFGELELG